MTEQLFGFGITLVAGTIGFWLFRLIRFPAAAMLGSMSATALLGITGWVPPFNGGPLSFVCGVGIGIFLGRQINRRVLCSVKSMLRPVLVQIGCLLLLSLGLGYIFYLMDSGKGMPLGTALVSTSTGGLTEMMVFGLSIGGDVGVIAFVQLFRIITFLSLIPYSAKLAKRLGDKRSPVKSDDCLNLTKFSCPQYVLLVFTAFAGAYIGLRLEIPAGSLLGAMCFSGALAMLLNRKYEYKYAIRYAAQIGLGMVMGQRIDSGILSRLASLFLPVLGITAVMLLGCLLLAFIQYKTTRYDLTTCLMCSSPAGLSQIAIYAEEAGADVFTISVFHTARLVSIVIIYPWLIMHLI